MLPWPGGYDDGGADHIAGAALERGASITLLQHWHEELKLLVPTD